LESTTDQTHVIPNDCVRPTWVQEKFGVTGGCVHRWMTRRKDPLTYYRVGGLVFISLAELRAWIARNSGRSEGGETPRPTDAPESQKRRAEAAAREARELMKSR
jgi:hypothetical protein